MPMFKYARVAAFALALLPISLSSLVSGSASAGSRYGTPPPLTLSPDLSSPWTLQLQPRSRSGRVAQQRLRKQRRIRKAARTQRTKRRVRRATSRRVQTASLRSSGARIGRAPVKNRAEFNPALLPTTVAFNGSERPGTVIVDTIQRRLFLVMPGGKARRYAVGVGKPGFEWAGVHKVTRKQEWPSWTPPKEMIARERKKGRNLPSFMPGGPTNPMGARALYLGSTLYRIHGTTQNWSIGQAVSSGCIRMRNQDVMDLYERVPVGARVKVI